MGNSEAPRITTLPSPNYNEVMREMMSIAPDSAPGIYTDEGVTLAEIERINQANIDQGAHDE